MNRKLSIVISLLFLLVSGSAIAYSQGAQCSSGGSAGSDPDGQFWDAVKNSSDVKSFRSYLDAFPNGRCAAEARQRINPPPAPVGGSSNADDEFWDAVKNSSQAKDFQSYLNAFPNGKFAALARFKLSNQASPPAATAPQGIRASFVHEFQTNSQENVTAVAFSPDGRTIASGGWGNELKLWNAFSGSAIWSRSLRGSGDLILGLTFSPDGTSIVTGSRKDSRNRGATINAWSVTNGNPSFVLPNAPAAFCPSIAYSLDRSRIIAGCFDQTTGARTVRAWDGRNTADMYTVTGVESLVSISPDGNRFTASNGLTQLLILFDTLTGHEQVTIQGRSYGGFSSVAFSPDSSRVVTGNGNGSIKIWDARSGQDLLTISGHSSAVNSIAYSPDGSTIVSGSEDTTVTLWNAATGAAISIIKGNVPAQSVAFSPDGRRIAIGGSDGIRVWRIDRKN